MQICKPSGSVLFGSGRNKLVKLLIRSRNREGRTVRSLVTVHVVNGGFAAFYICLWLVCVVACLVIWCCDQLCIIFSGRADPNCALGHVLKVLFKNDDFMTKVCSFECSSAVSSKS